MPPFFEKLKVKFLHIAAEFPRCAHPMEDLAYDLFAIEDSIVRGGGEVTKLRTGVSVELPGYGFLVKERSSWGIQGIITVGGVIDPGYRGELFIHVVKFTPGDLGVKKGNRIAQMIPVKVDTAWAPIEAKELSSSDRGSGGYGSTGK